MISGYSMPNDSSTTPDVILRFEGISRDFPGVRALEGVSFDIRRGEVHALVGENGAGKSTLMHIVGGVLRPSSGRIVFEGQEVSFGSAREAHTLGIRVVYQELSVVPNLTVAENIYANCQPVNALGLVRKDELNRRAAEMIELFGEDIDPDLPVSELPIGKRQILEILKALTFHPKVVLLDEPTSSLSAVETATFFRTVRRLKNEGMSFVFISHHLPEVFEIADRVTVLRDGVYQGTYDTGDIDEDGLIARMVGRQIGDMFGGRKAYGGKLHPRLEVSGLLRRGAFENVSFSIAAGEIVGFAGLVGAGRTEVASALFGLTKADSGTIAVDGVPVAIRSVRDAIHCGMGYLTEDRKLRGLCLALSVRDNLAAPSLDRFVTVAGILGDRHIDRYAGDLKRRFNIVAPSVESIVFNLSGGNQQKVLLGMWMGIGPKVFIADEPTRGVDVGAKEEIYRHIGDLAASGAAIMFISSDLNEILGMSDRICVMRQGRLVASMPRSEASEERIIAYALGAGEAVR